MRVTAPCLQELYVAVTKATLQDEVVPKEKHVRSEWPSQAYPSTTTSLAPPSRPWRCTDTL